jgi:hypothetical protein
MSMPGSVDCFRGNAAPREPAYTCPPGVPAGEGIKRGRGNKTGTQLVSQDHKTSRVPVSFLKTSRVPVSFLVSLPKTSRVPVSFPSSPFRFPAVFLWPAAARLRLSVAVWISRLGATQERDRFGLLSGRGWISKPGMTMPKHPWQGTGVSSEACIAGDHRSAD